MRGVENKQPSYYPVSGGQLGNSLTTQSLERIELDKEIIFSKRL